MEIEFKGDNIIFDRELSLLDSFVLNFTELLITNNIKYVIISGYVAILFGRSRISEEFEKSSCYKIGKKRKYYSQH